MDALSSVMEQLKLYGNNIVGLSVDSTGTEITRQVFLMDDRWRLALDRHRDMKQADINSRKQRLLIVVEDVKERLKIATDVLNNGVKCNVDALTQHRDSLQVCEYGFANYVCHFK